MMISRERWVPLDISRGRYRLLQSGACCGLATEPAQPPFPAFNVWFSSGWFALWGPWLGLCFGRGYNVPGDADIQSWAEAANDALLEGSLKSHVGYALPKQTQLPFPSSWVQGANQPAAAAQPGRGRPSSLHTASLKATRKQGFLIRKHTGSKLDNICKEPCICL